MLTVDCANRIPCLHINFSCPVFSSSSSVITVTLWLNSADSPPRVLSSFVGEPCCLHHGAWGWPPDAIARWGLHSAFVQSPADFFYFPTPFMNLACSFGIGQNPKSLIQFTGEPWRRWFGSGQGFKRRTARGQVPAPVQSLKSSGSSLTAGL